MAEENNKSLNVPAIPGQGMDLPALKVGSKGYLVPDTLDSQWAIAHIIAMSGLAPKDMNKVSTCFTAIQLGAEVGLAPMQAVQSIAVINGRPTIWGDAQLALVKAHPDYDWIKERVEGSGKNMVATCEVKRKSEQISVLQSFSYEEATMAGLTNKPGPWKQYPRRMLQMRARGFALRDAFPDVLKGLSRTAEEAIDMDMDEHGTYQVTEVQEVVNKAKAPKKEDPLDLKVNKQTGEIEPEPEPKPKPEKLATGTWERDEWIKLRAAGYRKYVEDNIDTLHAMPEEIQLEVVGKWKNLYGGEPFPEYSDQEPEEDPFTEPELVPETTEPQRVECPDRERSSMFVDYCKDECQNRTGCPAFDD